MYSEAVVKELLLINKPFEVANIEVKTIYGLLTISYNKNMLCLQYKGEKYTVKSFYILIMRNTNELKSLSTKVNGKICYIEDITYEYLDFILKVIRDFNKLNNK